MGGEVVKFAGLEAERFGEEADLEFGGGFRFLSQEAEHAAPVERSNVADDGSVLGQFGNLARIRIGVVEITGGVDQLELKSLLA